MIPGAGSCLQPTASACLQLTVSTPRVQHAALITGRRPAGRRPARTHRTHKGRAGCPARPGDLTSAHQPCLVSQKIFEISSIFASSLSAVATSVLPLVPPAPASLVASLNSSFSCGYFAKCGGLK